MFCLAGWAHACIYPAFMRMIFKNITEIEDFLKKVHFLQCPFCAAVETMIRHGYIRWFKSPKENGIRAWRIRCKKSAQRKGCGITFNIRLGDWIPRRCFDSKQLWVFIRALAKTQSIKAAWEHARIPISLDTGYRIYRHLLLCQSVLRTHLCARSPPPEIKTGVPLFQVFEHLEEVFGCINPIRDYQLHFQKSFLAVS